MRKEERKEMKKGLEEERKNEKGKGKRKEKEEVCTL